jgi:putative hydrolase of the HAD superfamily
MGFRPVRSVSFHAVKAILLDALGTLVRLEPPAPRLRAELAERFGVEVNEAQAERAIAAEIVYYRGHLDQGSDWERLTELRGRCAEALRAALPPSGRLEAIEPPALTEALLASLRFTAYPDVQPALRHGREGGLRLVVVSNWDVSLHEVLERLELAPLLDGILTSAEVGMRKPGARIFERALDLAGVAPGEAVHVGDNLDEDVAGARNAGIAPVLIRRDDRPAPTDVEVIGALTELFERTT